MPQSSTSVPASFPAYPDDEKANIFVRDTLRVYCEHEIDQERRTAHDRTLFEVVPDSNGETEKVTLVYGGDNTPQLSETPENDKQKTLNKKPEEGGDRRYVLECKAVSPDLALLQREFWQKLKEPNVYKIGGIGEGSFTVKAYCPDRFTLATDFPPLKSYSGGVKIKEDLDEAEEVEETKRQVTVTVEEKSWAPTDQRLETVDAQVVANPDEISVDLESEEKNAPAEAIRLRRNDQYVEANVVELASSGLQLASTIQELINRVQDNAPKFGWYFEAQTHVMKGTLNFKWGWREYAKEGQEHRAFYWLCFEADIALLQVNVELGIGVEGFGFELQVFGLIKGEVRFKSAVQRVSPEGDMGVKAELKGDIVGALGARFEAPYVAEAEGKIKTRLSMEGELRARQDDGLRLTLDSYWNGITALVAWSVGAQAKMGSTQQLENTSSIEVVSPPAGQKGFLLGQWTWPDDSRYEPERLPRPEVKEVFEEVFKKGHVVLGGKYDVRVREHGHRYREDWSFFEGDHKEPDYSWWSTDEVVEAVVNKVEERPNLDLRRKSVEALALEIRKKLEGKMKAHEEEYDQKIEDPERSPDVPFPERAQSMDWKSEGGTPHLRAVDYEAYLESDAFQDLLDDYVDPIQEKLHRIAQKQA